MHQKKEQRTVANKRQQMNDIKSMEHIPCLYWAIRIAQTYFEMIDLQLNVCRMDSDLVHTYCKTKAQYWFSLWGVFESANHHINRCKMWTYVSVTVCLRDRPNYVNKRALWTEQAESNEWRSVEATWKQKKHKFENTFEMKNKKCF